MTTSTLLAPAELDEHEFHIPCEWEDTPCSANAFIVMKGCSDPHPRALCIDHYIALRQWFVHQMPAICSGCHRPFMHFETHYQEVAL